MVREILNTKEVREKLGNFMSLALALPDLFVHLN